MGLFLSRLLKLKIGIVTASRRLVTNLVTSTNNSIFSFLKGHAVLGEISVNAVIEAVKFFFPLYAIVTFKSVPSHTKLFISCMYNGDLIMLSTLSSGVIVKELFPALIRLVPER